MTSEYYYPQLTRITITYDKSNRLLTMYQDGKKLVNKTYQEEVIRYKKSMVLYWYRETEEKKTEKVFVDSLMILPIGTNHYNKTKYKNYTNHKDLVI